MDRLKAKVFIALGTASVCWSPSPGNAVFDSDLATKIGDELWAEIEKHLEQKPVDVVTATKVVREALKADQELYNAWKANIAMAMYDTFRFQKSPFSIDQQALHRTSNNAADRFLKLFLMDPVVEPTTQTKTPNATV